MGKGYSVEQFAAGSCYSYMVSNGGEALLIDPHISLVEKYGKKLTGKGLSLVGIVDTHTHADHISSAALLRKQYDVPLYMSEKSQSAVATERLKGGDVIKVGGTEISVVYTPGHTDDSVSLFIEDGDVFTGDVLLIKSVGRTDFQNGSPEDMFDSLGKLGALPSDAILRPAHDYHGKKSSTIGEENLGNSFLLEKDKIEFCENARSKRIPKPANMDIIIEANQKGTTEKFSEVSAREAFEKLSEGKGVLLDVRRAEELDAMSAKVENVEHVPLQSLGSAMGTMLRDKSYYVLCRSGHRATMAAMSLMQSGFSNVAVIEGGLNAWAKAKLPVNKVAGPISLERQVRIAAGGLIVIGSVLSIFVSLWFIILPLWVGCGLVFAGVSDNCMMGLLLMKLPYNKRGLSGGQGGSCSMDGGGCAM